MPYAFVAHVSFHEGTDPDFAQKMLEGEVVPFVKSQAGFQKGIWARNVDGKSGIGTAVFDTEANAKAAGEAIRAQPRPAQAPQITSTGVYEVVAEA
jgi:hypothetical protein